MSHTVSPTEESKHNFSGIQNRKSDDTIIVPIPPDNRLMSSNALNQGESQEYNQDVFGGKRMTKSNIPVVEFDEAPDSEIDDYHSDKSSQKSKPKSDHFTQKQFENEVNRKATLSFRQKVSEKKSATKNINLVIDYDNAENYKRIDRVQKLADKKNIEILKQKNANDLMSQINMDQMILGIESHRGLREDNQDAEESPDKSMFTNNEFIGKFSREY